MARIKPQDAIPGGRSPSSALDGQFKHEWKDGREHQLGYNSPDEALKDKHTNFPVEIVNDKIEHTRE